MISSDAKRLQFENLPLISVAIRLTLAIELPLSLAFITDLFKEIPPEFSEIQDLPYLEQPPGRLPVQLRASRGPIGARFVNPETGMALDIQTDMIAVRWLGWNATEQAQRGYPSFDVSLPLIKVLIICIEKLLGSNFVKVDVANMIYTNLIDKQPPLTHRLLASYLSTFAVDESLMDYEINAMDLSLKLGKGIDYRAHVDAFTDSNNTPSGFMVTHSAGTALGFTENAEDIFSGICRVHDALVNMFELALTELARTEWSMK